MSACAGDTPVYCTRPPSVHIITADGSWSMTFPESGGVEAEPNLATSLFSGTVYPLTVANLPPLSIITLAYTSSPTTRKPD